MGTFQRSLLRRSVPAPMNEEGGIGEGDVLSRLNGFHRRRGRAAPAAQHRHIGIAAVQAHQVGIRMDDVDFMSSRLLFHATRTLSRSEKQVTSRSWAASAGGGGGDVRRHGTAPAGRRRRSAPPGRCSTGRTPCWTWGRPADRSRSQPSSSRRRSGSPHPPPAGEEAI